MGNRGYMYVSTPPRGPHRMFLGGIEIVELHNHALEDEPRLFYLHFWANDDAVQLAQALSEAVKAHNVKPAD